MKKGTHLIGSWRLQNCRRFDTKGNELTDSLADAEGLILYTDVGVMSATLITQAFKTPKPEYENYPTQPPFDNIPVEVAYNSLQGYLSYTANYHANEKQACVTHHITASNLPQFIGKTLTRKFSFIDADHLVLTTEVQNKNSPDGFFRQLLWKRITTINY